jgi:hypothetical protein
MRPNTKIKNKCDLKIRTAVEPSSIAVMCLTPIVA